MSKEEELKDLHVRRGILKGQLTRFESFLTELNTDTTKIGQLQARLDKLSLVWSGFDEVQTRVELLCAANITSAEIQERETFENKYFDLVCKAGNLLKLNGATVANAQTSSQTSQPQGVQLDVKLPLIKIPEFSGAYEKWFNFRDTFETLINKNPNLKDVQKYFYLQSALQGEAAHVISSLEVSEANYKVAWKLLSERFENKKVIERMHLKHLFELPNVASNSHASLRQFSDNFLKHYRALENLKLPVKTWDAILLYLLVSKLDFISKKEWENASNDKDNPTIQDFIDFISKRCQLLESIDAKGSFGNPKKYQETKTHSHVATSGVSCNFCKGAHFIFACKKLLSLDKPARLVELKNKKLCTNCLRQGHSNLECRASGCKICNKRHNSMLHMEKNTREVNSNTQNSNSNSNTEKTAVSDNNQAQNETSSNVSQQETDTSLDSNTNNSQNVSLSNHSSPSRDNFVLLSTAIVYILNNKNEPVKCRALLDSGSQSSFMTQEIFKKLNLKSYPVNIPVLGINSASVKVSQKTLATIKSVYNNYQTEISFLILDKITGNVPQYTLNCSKLNIPKNIEMADPSFYKSSQIDILIGSSIFFELLSIGQIKLGPGNPVLQKSALGWLISGPVQIMPIYTNVVNNTPINSLTTSVDISAQLEKFWLTEEIPQQKFYTKEETECEQHFVNNFQRDPITGRFIVKFPLRDNYTKLGESINSSTKRFYNLENRLLKHHTLREQYVNFMNEYSLLNHMSKIDPKEDSPDISFYLPHHCVQNDASLTTKLRVVFDGSAKTSTDLSLNDVLKVGPIVQDDLFNILIRLRKHNVVLIADIAKMYRQIKIHPEHRSLQRIIWRSDQSEPLSYYNLNTVTYGTSAASFLSTRCLVQLAKENEVNYPIASQTIIHDFYVDDLITGTQDTLAAKSLFNDLNTIFNSACMELRKWASNKPEIFSHMSQSSTHTSNFIITGETSYKTLGLTWDPKNDQFQYVNSNKKPYDGSRVTKRIILSTVSQIFDPLGLVGPVVLRAKLLLQEIWTLKLDWDESLPADLHTRWKEFHRTLHILNTLRIPRQITLPSYKDIQIHAFCDASQHAYGSCIYLRTLSERGDVLIRLITAKSRVAPLKTLTVPRLELSGAVVMARLVKKVTTALKLDISNINYWCDSTIILAWLMTEPAKLKTFVSNRIAEIQRVTDISKWRHVSSVDNPADLISRGLEPEEIINCSLWWHGPPWLKLDQSYWPQSPNISITNLPEVKKNTQTHACINTSDQDIFCKFSSFSKLVRVTAYCFRFAQNTRRSPESRLSGFLTIQETNNALTSLIRLAQLSQFSEEINLLQKRQNVATNSKIVSLDPFLDENGILRVGGRLRNANLQFSQRHPIILPAKHNLTYLIIEYIHVKNLHSGTQATLNFLRQEYWPVNAKSAVKNILRKCISCFRIRPTNLCQKMANLPASRVTASRPFKICGVDYAGPFLIRDGKLRNRKLIKSYLCIFVCFSSKAVHLEVSTDLTKEGFLNALKRFISRRGICHQIYSDNATNFTAANRELQQIATFCSNERIQRFLLDNQISWKFIPARSPHMGGLWESAVKSAKQHLKHVLKNINLTYEEFYTLTSQVESILNSRPLYPLSTDPHDLDPLTPGHFLVGEPLNALPQECSVEGTHLSRYQHLQRMLNHFWKRWSTDYLHLLQQRTKWRFKKDIPNLKGALVLLKEENLPPQLWSMGRIINVHPGDGGLVRVVEVQTRNGIVKRSITKVCVLPIE